MFHYWIEHHNLLRPNQSTGILRNFNEPSQRILCKTVIDGVKANLVQTTQTSAHVAWAMESVGYAFAVDLAEGGADIVKEALVIYSNWLQNCPSCMKSQEQKFIRDIVGHFTLLFEDRPDQSLIEYHQKLATRTLVVLQELFHKRGAELTPETWDYCIRLLIGAADNLLCRKYNERDLGSKIAIPLTRLTYECFLRALPFTGPNTELWDLLDRFMQRWGHRLTTINQWNSVCMCMTQCIMIEIAARKPPAEMVNLKIQWVVEDPILEISLQMRDLEFAWHRCLHVLNNPNRLEHKEATDGLRFVTSSVHSTAIGGVCALADLLLSAGLGPTSLQTSKIYDFLPIEANTDCNTILMMLGAWLFDAALNYKKSEYSEGRSKAIGALGRIFCAQWKQGPGNELLVPHQSRYIVMLKYALEAEKSDERSIAAALHYSRRCLSSNISGVRILIPVLNKAVEKILTLPTQVVVPKPNNQSPLTKGRRVITVQPTRTETQMFGGVPVKFLRKACAEILSGQMFIHKHFQRLHEIDVQIAQSSIIGGLVRHIPVLGLQVKDLLLRALKTETDVITCCTLVWMCEGLVRQDSTHTSEVLPFIATQVLSSDDTWATEVRLVAIKVFGDLSEDVEILRVDNLKVVIDIVQALCLFISYALEAISNFKTTVSTALLKHAYISLSQWVAKAGWLLTPQSSWRQLASTIQNVVVRGGAGLEPNLDPEIQIVAKSLFQYCLRHSGRFPTSAGHEAFSSLLTEEMAIQAFDNAESSINKNNLITYYLLDSKMVLSAIEFTSPEAKEDSTIVVIIRDATGRYAWRLTPMTTLNGFNESFQDVQPPPHGPVFDSPNNQLTSADPLLAAIRSVANELVSWNKCTPEPYAGTGDSMQLQAPVVEGEANNGECVPTERVEEPDWMINFKLRLQEQYQVERSTPLSWVHSHLPPCEPLAHPPLSAQNNHLVKTRRLFAHTGSISLETWGRVHPICDSDQFKEKLAALDDTPEREQYEVWIMCARNSISSEGALGIELLFGKDTQTSPDYEAFLRSVGWLVNIRTHTGFLADIDPSIMDGELLYYSNAYEEVVFHVPTIALTASQRIWSEQGNRGSVYYDNAAERDSSQRPNQAPVVVVLWNECQQQVTPGSPVWPEFGLAKAHVFIIIDRLRAGLYRTRVSFQHSVCYNQTRSEHCQHIPGPLVDGMCVTREMLGPLVRQTALNACRDTLEYRRQFPSRDTRGNDRPQVQRQRVIDRISEEHLDRSSPAILTATLCDANVDNLVL